jgi:uncharacterized protein (TIGR00730 family)
MPPPTAPSCRTNLSSTYPIKNIAVFCASADGADATYRTVAAEVGRALAVRGIGVVNGGGRVGLMQAVSDAALAEGGRVVGVIPTKLMDLELAHGGLTELHVTDTMHTRKAMMGARADAFIVLPGGFGTFEELFEVLAWQTLKIHDKPVVLLNADGFYDTLLRFLDECVTKGMLKAENRSVVLVAQTVDEALKVLGIA